MRITRLIYFFLLFTFFLIFSPNSVTAQCAAGETSNTYCYDDGEVNVVAFEFCPTAGMIAQSTINAGSYSNIFPVNLEGLTVYEGASGSGTAGTIVLGPVDGDLAGTVITASAPDLCLIFVSNSNVLLVPTSCADGVQTELEVCSESIPAANVDFTAPDDLCINAGVQTGLGGGTPTGGVYSGDGVTDNGDGLTYNFDPASAGTGVHTLTYTSGGNSASDDVEVFAIPSVSFTALADLCIDAGVQTGLGGGTPTGGVYSGSGVTDDGNGTTYTFNPAFAGLGMHTITYTESSTCAATATDNVEVLAACSCLAPQSSFFHCSASGETNLVIFEVCPNAGEFARANIEEGTYSVAGNNLTIYQGASGSGTGGTIVFGPQSGDLSGNVITSTVADECLIFVSTTLVGGCQGGLETPLLVCGESLDDAVFFTAPDDFCIDDGIQTNLSGGIPTGGIYSGTGVTDDGNGMTYTFDPATAGAGVHTLTYTLGGSSANDDVEVFALPVVSLTTPPDFCIDEGIQTLGGGLPAGGVYSGAGVTDNGNGLTYSFNPALAGLGVHTVTYTEGGVCMEMTSDNISVIAACTCPAGEVTFYNCYDNNETNLAIFEVCPNAGEFAQAEIDQGTYGAPDDFLTIYQGASGSGTGGTIVFGPLNGNFAGNNIISTVADECLIFVNNTGPFVSCSEGLALPLVVCGSSLTSNVTFTALDDLSVNAGVQAGLSGGLPTGGVYSGPGVTDDGNGMTYTFDPAIAGVGVHTLTYTTGSGSATDDVEVFNLLPPSFSKSFNSNQIGPGSVSTLTFTINNSASGVGVTNLAFTDNLPAGMTIANPPVVVSSCTNTVISAPAGGSTISLTDGSVGAGSFCTISVNVTSNTAGTHTNTTGDLTSSSGNSGTASANLTVATNRPGFSKSFSPSTVNLGERSTVTFTIDNTLNTVAHSNITFTDNLPAGMVVANPSNATIGCTGGVITAVPGSSIISYTGTIFTDASVAAGGTCTISVDVVGESVGQLDNVTGDLTSLNNFFQTLNSGKASAILEVLTPPDILLQKRFVTNPASPGGTTNLEFTISNMNRDFEATNISFTDDLTTVLAGLTAIGTPLNDICGTGSQLSGTTLLTFTGGTIPANGSCTFSIPVQIPAGATPGTYINVTSNITADIDGSTITGNTATENLYIANVPTFTKTFLNDPVVAGGTATLEFTITNTSTTSTLTDLTFTDPISDFISGTNTSSLPAAGSCGTGSLFFQTTVLGDPVFQMTGGNIAPGGSCTFSIDLLIPTGVSSGTYTNTTSLLSGTVDGGSVNVDPATDDLTVLAMPTISKTFTDDPVNAGDIVNLEFTITYDEFATGDATNISFTDDLNAVIPGLAAVGLPLNDICGTGASISGTTNLTFSGGTLSPGGSCTFSVPVQVPAGIAPGAYTNTTSALTATVGGQSGTGNTATDDLDIGGINFTKEFLDDTVIPGETTTLRFTIENTSTFDASSIFFTDNFSGLIPGMVAQAPLPTTPCGAASLTSGTSFFIFFSGEVDAGNSCSFDVDVLVPASAANGTYTNITSNLSATLDGVARNLSPAIDDLVVNNNLISLTKTFTDDPVSPGGTVTVEYTLTNLDPDNAISNIAFTDDFDGALTGLAATGLPMSVCGGTVSGTGLLSFTGGTLAAGASCTFSVTLQTPASTPFGTIVSCPTSEVTGELNGLSVEGDAANDDLQFQSLQFTKAFAGSVAPGGTTVLTFTITNADPTNSISQISFTDDLDAVISGMIATILPTDLSLCGALAGISGTSELSFGRGELGPGESCSFDVTVMIPCGTAANTYTNTTSTITGDGASGGSVEAPAATADITVTATSVAAFTAPADLCIDAGNQTGLGGGTPTGGIYSGPGVTDGANGMTYSFNPATAGVGTHTITYTFTDGNSCVTMASDMIEVFALPTVMFTAPADLCIDAGTQTGLGGGTPAQGTATGDMGVYSGPGVTDAGNGMTYSFNPTTAGVGTHTITYTYTNENSCTASASDMIEVFALPTVMFTAPADLCIDAGNQTGLGGGTPAQGTATGDLGVYSGPGITDAGNGMTYSFNPVTAGVGTHTITYTYTNENSCSASASDMIEVFALPTVMFTAPVDLCIDAGNQTGLGGGTPTGGIYSGPGVTDGANGMTYSFNPATAGVGVHTITYTFTDGNSCVTMASDMIEVFALPTVMFTAPADLCIDAGIQTGLGGGTPAQGTATGDLGVYSGSGVTDDGNGMTYSFNPMTAGAGTHILTYTYTDENGCSASASDMIEVFALPTVMFTAPADLCIDAGNQTGLGGGTPVQGTATGDLGVYSGPGVTDAGNGMTYSFNPMTAGAGTHTLTYTYTDENGCSASASDMVEVFALPVLSFTAPADGCIDGGIRLGMGQSTTPEGGVFSGPGVTDDGNGDSFTFNPATAGVGTHMLTYTFTDANGCTQTATDDIEIFALPTVTFTALADLCLNDGVQNNLGGGTPTGGVYSGDGVTDDGNGMTYDFNPATAGVGTHTITYTFTDVNGCTNSASDDVEVFAVPDVMFTAPADLCLNAGVQANLGGGSPTGGVYSGDGVTDDGNGMTYDFDPAAAGVGTHTITYTVGVAGCTDSTMDDVEVFALPSVSMNIPAAQDEFCVDANVELINLAGSPNGGVYSGAGVMDLGTGLSFTFNPAVAGVGTHTVTYTITDVNGCSNSATDQIVVNALPVVMFTAPADLCLNDGVQNNLGGGTPTGGVYSGDGVTDDGNGMTYDFDPVIAGVGTHTITYTFTNVNGCTNSASDNIEVIALPVVTFTAPADLCIDAGEQTNLGGGSPTGGVYSGAGVTDNGDGTTYDFDPAAAGVGTHTITYTVGVAGCTNSAMDDVEVFALPSVSMNIPAAQDEFCVDANVELINLAGSPNGGVYSGAGVMDLGTGLSFTFTPATAGVGTHTVTYTITDVNGCSNSATDQIVVNALPIVMFTAPADLCVDAGIQAGLGGGTPPQGTVTGDMGVYSGPGVTDGGNGMTYSFNPATAGVGVHTLTYTYTNENGCTDSASDMIEVFTLPVVTFTAPDIDVCIDDAVVTGLGGGMPTGGVYSGTGVADDGNGETFSFDPTASAPTGGDVTVTYTFTDVNGCSASADDDIFVNPICCELIVVCPPMSLGTITCNAAIPTAANDEASFEVLGGDISDDPEQCGTLVITHMDVYDPPTDICNGRTMTRTYTISDDLTSEECIQTLMISAPVAPMITCPTDMTVECFSDISVDPADAVVATDCSQGFNTVITGPVQSGDSDCPATTYTYTYTVTDDCGRTAACEQVFTIQNDAPTITCPADMTVECFVDISVDPADAVVTTSCTLGSNTVITGPVQNGDSDCAATTYTYTYTVTDDCGRIAACEQVFTIQNDAPTITCPVDMTVECLSDISLDPADAVVTTSCTLGSNTVITGPVQNGDSDCPATTYTYTYTVTDDCGRTAACEQVFTIQNDAPTITCPADMTVECLSDISLDPADAVVTTSCALGSNTVITGPVQSGDSDCPATTYTYTYTVTDDCGRTAACEQVFTIQNAGPEITCPADMIVECFADISVDPADAIVVTSCALGFNTVITGPIVEGQTDCVGTTYTYTYTTTDDCGRTADCKQVFTIQNLAPIVVCPADEIVTCEEDIIADPNNLIVTTSCGLGYLAYVENPLITGGIPGCDGTVYTYIYNVTDDCGRTRSCSQQFTIQNSAPTVTVPADELVMCFSDIEVSISDVTVEADCDGAIIINVIGPVIDGPENCPGTTYTYTYRVEDFCDRVVETERVFTILDNGGPVIVAPADFVSECEVGVNPDNAVVTTSCSDGIGYQVMVSDPVITGQQGCSGTTLEYTYTVIDACGGTDSDIQIITIDNDGPVIECPQPLNILNCEDGDYNALIDAWIATVTATAYCGGEINVTNDYDGVNGLCISNGFTSVTFIATDECGTTNTCIGTIIITDTEAPIIFEDPQELLIPCNGVTQFIFDNWLATQGGAQAIDGCWGNDITWSMVPSNPMLDCDGGPQAIIVEFVATDGCGNSSSTTGIFTTKLQPDFVNISGQIYREDDEAVENVTIGIEGGVAGIPDIDYTNNSGGYGFPELEYEDDLYVVPEKNDDPTNGVSTFDLVLMRKHLLGIELFDSPYKYIAADVNRSGHFSTIDMVLLRKIILSIDTEFEFNSSWRFVDASFVFPNPENPFETPFPEQFDLSGLESELADFIGIKIGDLNLNAIANGLMAEVEDRSGLDDLLFEVEDQELKSGAQYTIDFRAQNFKQMEGFQFTINFDPSVLEVLEVQNGDLINFDDKNYGLSKLDNGAVTFSWDHESLVDLRSEEIVFSLKVNAITEAMLSEILSITSAYTRAEAYQADGLMNVDLAFNQEGETVVQSQKFRIFQNQPNPFKEATMIGFNLPETGVVNLEVYDVSGRLIYSESGDYTKGYNQIDLDRASLPAGVLYYHIKTATDSGSKKMIVID